MTRVAIIGGGLAGAACAYILKQEGLEPVIYEASDALASGASGNKTGMYNPRLAAEITAESAYFMSAFKRARQVFEKLDDIDWNPCGALHLITDEKREIRYSKMAKNWGWSENELCLVDSAKASDIADIDVMYDALYLPSSGAVSPKKLCDALAEGVEVQLNSKVENLGDIKADATIIASGMASQNYQETQALGLKAVRGQITYTAPSEQSMELKAALCYGGYVTPAFNGEHIVGSTFQRWLDHSDILAQDDLDNLERLGEFVPSLSGAMEIVGQRASVRTTSRDHFPVVGQVSERVFISTAHGSHGIISSIEAAHLLCNLIKGQASNLSAETIERLSPSRYIQAS